MTNFETSRDVVSPARKSTETLARPEVLWLKESMASSPHTLLNAIKALQEFTQSNEFQIQNGPDGKLPPEAQRLYQMKDQLRRELPQLQSLLASKADTNVADINAFLKSRGFSIELKDQWPGGVYVASCFNQKVEWENAGKKTTVHLESSNVDVPGVHMKHVGRFEFEGVSVYELRTKDGSTVYVMSEKKVRERNPLDFYATVSRIDAGMSAKWKCDLNFPMVDFQEKWDITWLKNAKIWDAVVAEAKYENMLQMDEMGAEAKASAAIGATRSLSAVDTIDGPMLVWFKKWDAITFAARVGTNDMKQPQRK